ncbi:MAG: KEOPS complex kinase/ATPase Bud32 [Candidatus Woesearchaeota archaeon]
MVSKMKEIARGAEAVIFLDKGKVVKKRIKKGYRIDEIDRKLRRFRTCREAKIIQKLDKLDFCVPSDVYTDGEETISMDFIEGKKLRDNLDSKNYKRLCLELGRIVKKLHDIHIIHGDLTTSNFILNKKDKKIYFIDFGLSFYSYKVEDKAVDLHLLRQALESKHYQFCEDAMRQVLKGYNDPEVAARLEQVELRGRNKVKGMI